jgi:hypothetical protein
MDRVRGAAGQHPVDRHRVNGTAVVTGRASVTTGRAYAGPEPATVALGVAEPGPDDEVGRQAGATTAPVLSDAGTAAAVEAVALLGAAQAARVRQGQAAVQWARSLRRSTRAAVWAVPAAAVLFALAGPTGVQLAAAVGALGLGELGVIALTALFASTAARHWGVAALLATLAGTVLAAPALGAAAVSAPVGLPARVLAGAGVGALMLGWLALAAAVLVGGVLNGTDALVLIMAVAAGGTSVLFGLTALRVVAAVLLLAAGLGIASTASRFMEDEAH